MNDKIPTNNDLNELEKLQKKFRNEDKDIRNQSQEKKDGIEPLWEEVLKTGVKTDKNMGDVDKANEELEKALKARKNAIRDALKFAEAEKAYNDWVQPTLQLLSTRDFGNSLEELERYKNILEDMENKIGNENDEKKKALDSLWEGLEPLVPSKNNKNNNATKPKKERADKNHAAVKDAIKARRKAYEDEVAKKKKEDEERKKQQQQEHDAAKAKLERRKATRKEAAIPCKKCGRPVERSNVVLVDGVDMYHDECFRCSYHKGCNTEFKDYYWEYLKQPYCFEHYAEVADMFCPACKKAISDDKYIAAINNKKWHIKCFRCTICNQELIESNFYTHEGMPYCKKDLYRVKGLLCAKCDQPVGNGDKSALGKAWHRGCWYCTSCQKAFGADGFFDLGGFPYCPSCFKTKSDENKGGKTKKAK